MSIDDFLKIVLILSISFAIAGIAYQIMRLLNKLTEVTDKLKKPIDNVTQVTGYALEDYTSVRGVVYGIAHFVKGKFLGKFFKTSEKDDSPKQVEK